MKISFFFFHILKVKKKFSAHHSIFDFISIDSNIQYEDIHFFVFGLRSFCYNICVSIFGNISAAIKNLNYLLFLSYQPCKCSRWFERKFGWIFEIVRENFLYNSFWNRLLKTKISLFISDSSSKNLRTSSGKYYFLCSFFYWFSLLILNDSILPLSFIGLNSYQSSLICKFELFLWQYYKIVVICSEM